VARAAIAQSSNPHLADPHPAGGDLSVGDDEGGD